MKTKDGRNLIDDQISAKLGSLVVKRETTPFTPPKESP